MDGKVSAARQRAIAEFATWEVLFLGGDKTSGRATWDVRDAVGVNQVAADTTAKTYRCDCQGFVTGGGAACIHIELVREHRVRAAAAGQPRPAAPPTTTPEAAASVAPPPAPVAPSAPTAAPARSDTLLAAAGIIGELAAIRAALEGILAQMTPKEERDRAIIVDGYVRSSNKGGELVWLYGAHPGLQYRVAVVYAEDFPALTEFLDPSAGRVFDGEVAPSKATAATKGYLVVCRTPFEVALAPTGRRTDNDQMIYRFRAARAIGH